MNPVNEETGVATGANAMLLADVQCNGADATAAAVQHAAHALQ